MESVLSKEKKKKKKKAYAGQHIQLPAKILNHGGLGLDTPLMKPRPSPLPKFNNKKLRIFIETAMIRIRYIHMPTNQLHNQYTKYDRSFKLMISQNI